MGEKLVYYEPNFNPSNYIFFDMSLLKEPWNRTIDPRAAIIYSYLLNLCRFSEKNGWIDLDNKVYVKCRLEDLGNLVGVNRNTVRKFKQQLLDAGLIEIPGEQKSKRTTHAYPIYVKVIKPDQNNIVDLKKRKNNNSFNNFRQNNYDMETLEEKLRDN